MKNLKFLIITLMIISTNAIVSAQEILETDGSEKTFTSVFDQTFKLITNQLTSASAESNNALKALREKEYDHKNSCAHFFGPGDFTVEKARLDSAFIKSKKLSSDLSQVLNYYKKGLTSSKKQEHYKSLLLKKWNEVNIKT